MARLLHILWLPLGLNIAASVLFTLGSVLLIPALGETAYLSGVWLYLIGSVSLSAAALLDGWQSDGDHTQLFTAAGALFILGSIACLPTVVAVNPYLGPALFALGCLASIAGTGRPALHAIRALGRGQLLPEVYSTSGCGVFILGSGLALPEVGLYTTAAVLFIVGSLLFLVDTLSGSSSPSLAVAS